MIDTVVIQPGADTGEPSVAGVSWAAVAAGAIVCCAVTLVVLAFGIGWAFASVLGAVLLASPASNLLGGTAAGVAQGAVSSASRASPMDDYVDTLLRRDAPATQTSGQNSGNASDPRGEMVRLFSSSFRNGGDPKPADQEYVSKVVAARTGLSQADADKRVNDVVTQVKADMDAARKATAQLAFWLTASLLIGAFCASLAATEGGGLRDGTWHRKST